jgi:hypothetical protein
MHTLTQRAHTHNHDAIFRSSKHEKPAEIKQEVPLTEEDKIAEDFWNDPELQDPNFQPESFKDLEQLVDKVAGKYTGRYEALQRSKMAQL